MLTELVCVSEGSGPVWTQSPHPEVDLCCRSDALIWRSALMCRDETQDLRGACQTAFVSIFSDLDEVHQAVLITASEEGLPWKVAAEWSKDPDKRTTAEIEQSRQATTELTHQGLVWMLDYEASNRELTQDEVDVVLEDNRPWTYGSDVPHNIALYLTDSGKELYFGG